MSRHTRSRAYRDAGTGDIHVIARTATQGRETRVSDRSHARARFAGTRGVGALLRYGGGKKAPHVAEARRRGRYSNDITTVPCGGGGGANGDRISRGRDGYCIDLADDAAGPAAAPS